MKSAWATADPTTPHGFVDGLGLDLSDQSDPVPGLAPEEDRSAS